MTEGYYSRIAAYLSHYARLSDGSPVPPDVGLMKKLIRDMIRSDRITKQQMKAEALRLCDVIIREDFFPDDRTN